MGASRYLIGIVCAGLLVGCASGSTDGGAQDPDVDVDEASAPNLPPPPPGSECTLIQRGLNGAAQDADIGYGNGPNWTTGAMPYSWTGPSPYDHWSIYQFDTSVVPAGKVIVSATFSVTASWNMESSTVRAHRITKPWNEATANWNNFGGNGSWDPAVLGSFDPNGGGTFSVDVTNLAAGWVSGAIANNGLLLEEDPVKLHLYWSSEAGTVAMRPSLQLCWADAPPPACEPVGGSCAANADCCDGVPCSNGVCQIWQCGNAGAECSANSDCCNGNVCSNGVCGPPALLCGEPGDACGAGLPACCGGALCNDGVCPGLGGGNVCSPTGGACNADFDCCDGACQDGMCVATNQCVMQDSVDGNGEPIACDPWNPCCDGLHCVFGLCSNDFQCTLPGAACDDANGACCWGLTCTNGTCQ